MFVLISTYERVLGTERVVKSHAELRPPVWNGHRLTEPDDVQIGIENGSENNGVIIDISLFKIEKERHLLFHDRTTQLTAVPPRRVGRTGRSKRITRIQVLIIEAEKSLAVKAFGAGLSENLGAAETGAIILG